MKTSLAIFAELHLKGKLEKIAQKIQKEPAHISYGRFRQISSSFGFSKNETKQILAILAHKKVLSFSPTQIFNSSKPFSVPAKASIFSPNSETGRVLGKSQHIRETDSGGRHG